MWCRRATGPEPVSPVRSGARAGRQERGQDVLVDLAGVARSRVGHERADRHLVDPALLAVRAQDEPVGTRTLDELDLVALIELADLRGTQLVGRVEQSDDGVADDPPLAAVDGVHDAAV